MSSGKWSARGTEDGGPGVRPSLSASGKQATRTRTKQTDNWYSQHTKAGSALNGAASTQVLCGMAAETGVREGKADGNPDDDVSDQDVLNGCRQDGTRCEVASRLEDSSVAPCDKLYFVR